MTKKPYHILFSLLVIHASIGFAQKNHQTQTINNSYQKAMSLFEHKKYGSARMEFETFISNHQSTSTNLISEASFMVAQCADELNNDDTQYLYEKFLVQYPESNKVPYANFHVGELIQDTEKYKQATRWYEKVDANGLDENTKHTYWFKYGYCLFMEDDFDNATTYFLKLKDIESPHKLPTLYYYSHIQYSKKKYDIALKGFLKLEKDEAFETIVPFYIAQIYYLTGDYDKAIDYSTPLLDKGSPQRQADMTRIIGNAWYAKKQYPKATTFFEQTIELAKPPYREDYYHLGFCYYFQKKYDKAAQYLSKVTSKEDTLSQNAYYHLGDCFIKLGDKKRARVAFEAASKYNFDVNIQEDAMLNYLKLNYQMAYSPFNEIINSFIHFIELFPNSSKIDQAYEYLGKAFLTTKNYKQALESMEKIRKKDVNIYQAMQRIAYYRGLELFTTLQFDQAIAFFSQSLKYAEYDKSLKIKAYYWRGESNFRLAQYGKAKADYNEFMINTGSYKMEEFKTAHYNMGYVCFKEKDYPNAAEWFRKYLKLVGETPSEMTADSYNRLGDCMFVSREFNMAVSYFDKAINIPNGSPDYAMYQKAFCLGLMKRHPEKIELLKTLSKKYPNSAYLDDAQFEMGRSYVALNDLTNAIYCFKVVKDKYQQSSYAKKALLQLGLVYYNTNDLNNSITFYKRVINEYPGTQEAEQALVGIKNVYMDQNNPDGYIKYTETLGSFAKLDIREQDSLTFQSAQNFYLKNSCDNAIASFENYLIAFPDGQFAIDAYFLKGDCHYANKNYREALKSFDYVIAQNRNTYTEKALIRNGEINFMESNFDKALVLFQQLNSIAELTENQLEAKIGILRCLVKLKKNNEIIEAANQLLNTSKVAPEIEREAKFASAKAYDEIGDKTKAFDLYKALSSNTKSVEGAESKYRVAQMYFDEAKIDNAEKEVFDYADKGTPHQYWLARSFVLLSDIYMKRGELFQAQQYLESILQNYKHNDDIIPMTNDRLRVIKNQSAPKSQDEKQIQL